MKSRRVFLALGLAGLTLLAILPFLPALQNGFVWDDPEFIVNNKTIREIFPLARFFQRQGLVTSGDIYPATGSRPLTTLSLALDYHTWKLDPTGYHLTNLILHLLCVWATGLLAFQLTRSWTASGIAAAFFSVLPAHAEAVIALLGRSDLLATLFVIIGFVVYLKSAAHSGPSSIINDRLSLPPVIRYRSYFIWYLSSVICFLLACLSKETGMVLFGLIVGYELFFNPPRIWRRIIPRLVPFLLIGLFYWLYRGQVLKGNTAGLEWWGGTPFNNYLMSFQAYAKYVWLILFPAVLSPMHMVPIPAGIFFSLLGLLFALGTVVLVAAAVKKDRVLGVGALWFAIAMLPIANILPIPGMIMAERWLYMPTAGLCLAAGFAAFRYSRKISGIARVLVWISLLLILFIYSTRIFFWCPAWKTDESVARAVLKTSPESHMALNNLGKVLLERGQAREAEVLFRKALEQKPRYGVAHLNLAMVLRDQDRLEEAKAECLKAVEFSPGDPDAQNNLGVVLWRLGDLPTALEHFQEAIHLNPRSGTYHFNLGLALNQLGLIEEALAEFRIVVYIDPNNIDARLYIGYALGKLGKNQEAETELRALIKMKKNLPEAHYNLAGALEAQGRYAEAAEEYKIYLSGAPDAGNRNFVEGKIKKLYDQK